VCEPEPEKVVIGGLFVGVAREFGSKPEWLSRRFTLARKIGFVSQKDRRPVLIASASAASEAERRVRHRFHQ
jgi:hypothetical protein